MSVLVPKDFFVLKRLVWILNKLDGNGACIKYEFEILGKSKSLIAYLALDLNYYQSIEKCYKIFQAATLHNVC